MKYTFVLIATVFLIGITLSDAAQISKDKTVLEKEKANNEGIKGGKEAGKSGNGAKKDKQIPLEEEQEESDDDDDEEEDLPEEKAPAPAKKSENRKKVPSKPTKPTSTEASRKKKLIKKAASSEEDEDADEQVAAPRKRKARRKPASEEDEDSVEQVAAPRKRKARRKPTSEEDEESDEKEEFDPKLLKKLDNLQKKLKSVNPESLVSALRKTSDEKISKALPQLQDLSKTLKGTPLGPIIENLSSLFGGNNPQILNTVFKVFPNFLSTPITTLGLLGSNAITAVGRAGKSATEIGDTIFSALGDILDDVQDGTGYIPGADTVLGLAKQGLGTAQIITMDPLDSLAGSLTQSSKKVAKELERSRSRRRGSIL